MREWRRKNRGKFNVHKKRNYSKGRVRDCRSGEIWSGLEKRMLNRFPDMPDRVLGLLIGRSVQAIQVKRSRMKRGKR